MNSLIALIKCSQAVWLDFLERDFVAHGRLAELIEHDGVTGVTSNPAIFEKAIAAGGPYDAAIARALATAAGDALAVYEGLMIDDIRAAADRLRPVYEASGRRDGFVSLEVSPYLAHDTAATIAEARRLWSAVARDNLMIKVPATPAGVPAIRELLGAGINVNITLLFAQSVYHEVATAYLDGLERFIAQGGDAATLASVASFFVSRIDTVIDRALDARLTRAGDGEREALLALRGKIAIANAKLAYRRYQHLFAGPRWEALRAKGARPQRLLWASTGTKDPAYRDVLYVEELIGPDTVNTMPLATLEAFRDHGVARPSLTERVEDAELALSRLAALGISLDEITTELVEEGVQLFVDAADRALAAVATKREQVLGAALDPQEVRLPAALEREVAETVESWRRSGNVRRLWARDAGLWTGGAEAKWLGWLDAVDDAGGALEALAEFAAEIRREGFTQALLLGMGGSSLGPEVLARTFGPQPDHPALFVLDSTDPDEIRSAERRIDMGRTLFIVSSKSGTTLEPNILKDYFFERAGRDGRRFVAVTDPGSALERAARADGFRRVFFGRADIGGRYSVLSAFGMVPAAAIGLDLARFRAATRRMVEACAASVPPMANPGVRLGIALGVAARAGRDKLTIITTPGLADFGAWLEQLVAESTGKNGKGIIPIDQEPLAPPDRYGEDRLFVHLRLAEEVDEAQEAALGALAAAGQPVLRLTVTDRYHLGQEFFRWQIATAVAGAVIGIDPFDQPDVEASKVKTRELTAAVEATGAMPVEVPILVERGIALHADRRNAESLARAALERSLLAYLRAHLARLGAGDYCALLAYIERNDRHFEALQRMRQRIRDSKRVATCVEFGPRFLHSTGQAYKGGPNSGVFLQITAAPAELAIPGRGYGFAAVEAAQAQGDLAVLAERGRRALRLDLGADIASGLRLLGDAIAAALN